MADQSAPAGVTFDTQPHDAAPAGAPPGITFDAQPHDTVPQPGLLERSGLAPNAEGTGVGGTILAGAENLASGFNKGVAKTAAGIYDLAGGALKKVLPESLGNQIPNAGKAMGDTDPHGAMQHVGGGVEEMAEWAAGEEALKGVVKLAATPQAILDLIEKHPTASKIILDTIKGGAVGGAQGAVKNASAGKAKEGAIAGAEGGAAGSAIASTGEAALGGVLKKAGVAGLEPEEKLRKAAGGSASVREQNFEQNAKLALPRIAKENAIEPIKDEADFAEAAHNAKKDIWSGPNGYTSMIDRVMAKHPETISGDDIAQEIKNSVSPTTRKLYGEQADKIDKWADQFKGNIFLDAAKEHLVELNQRMRDFYSLSKADQFKMATADPQLGMLQDATDSLRDKIDAKLSALGETGSAELRKEYGALSQMQRVFEKRHIVYGRQAPVNIKQTMATVAAVASGHPLAAAIPFIDKYLNSPGHLIQSAIADTVPTGGTKPVGSAARKLGTVAKKAVEAGAGVGGENAWIKFKGGDGNMYEHHPDHSLADIQEADPKASYPEAP